MEQHEQPAPARRRHLLTDEQLSSRSGASADDLADGHREGNGIRIHRTYIIVVSLVALMLFGVAVALASATM